jgi:Protein of unknown function (DUF3631)
VVAPVTSFDLAIGETWDGDTVAFVLPSIPSDAPRAVREGRAREACVELLAAARTVDSGSLGVRLLADVRAVFGDQDKMSSAAIVNALTALDEAPGGDLRGRALDQRGLARRLAPYGVRSTEVKVDQVAVQGYRREDLYDAWARYLPTPAEAEPAEPTEPPRSESASPVRTCSRNRNRNRNRNRRHPR